MRPDIDEIRLKVDNPLLITPVLQAQVLSALAYIAELEAHQQELVETCLQLERERDALRADLKAVADALQSVVDSAHEQTYLKMLTIDKALARPGVQAILSPARQHSR